MTYLCHSAAAVRSIAAIALALVLFPSLSRTQEQPADAKVILETLQGQVVAWNRADLKEFMSVYANSEELTFSSGGLTRSGWQAIYRNYETKYGGKNDLGQLSFANLKVRMLGTDHALVLGDWSLIHDGKTSGGNFSLVLEKENGAWRIIHDHTSVKT